jgi:putative ABC transport system permease protein
LKKVALRGLLAHKGRLLATLLAIALGVAFVGGVRVLTDTMNQSFDDVFATAYKGTDAVVRSAQEIKGSGFGSEDTRGNVDASLLPTVQGAPDVSAAGGDVQGPVQVIDKDGDVAGQDFGPPTFGSNWQTVDQLSSWKIVDGKPPAADNQVVIDAGTADSTKYKVGDTMKVQTKQGIGDYEVAGIARFGTANSLAGASFVLFTMDEAQRVVLQPGQFTTISVVGDGVSQEALAKSLRSTLSGDNVEVLTGEEITKESQSDLKSQLSFFTYFLLAFAIIAIVVGAFVIYNSFSIVIAQRVREMALLRAIGASRKQIRRAVLLEALVVGLLGSVLGYLLGLLIAKGATSIMNVEGPLAVLPTSVAIAVGVGLVVTLLSAMIPARRASKVPPVAAMREVAIDTSGRSKKRFVFGLALLALGIVAIVVGATGYAVMTVALGAILSLVGVILAGPGLAGPVSAVVGWPLSRIRGVTGGLARLNAGRNPKRSAVTAYALMIGIGIMAFMLVVSSSLRGSFNKIMDESFGADFIILSGGFGTLGLPNSLAGAIQEDPDVKTVVPVRNTQAVVDGTTEAVTGTTPDAFGLFGYEVIEGTDDLGVGEAIVLKSLAKSQNLTVGGSLDAEFLNTGTASLTVAGIYEGDKTGDLGGLVVGLDEYSQLVPGATDAGLLVKLRSGVSTDDAKPRLEKIVKPLSTAKVQTADDYKKTVGALFDALLLMVTALLILAFIIAAVGIANTIALSVVERTRELGLLRAVGMTRRQLRATIRWESIIIAVFGASLGLLIGVLGGWGLVKSLGDEGFDVIRIPVAQLLLLALGAGLIGLLAALWPAWRASRLKVLDAVHTD